MSVNEESSYKILDNNIYKFRVLNTLSKKELAEKLNESAAYISQIENCRPNKGIASLIKIAQALQVPPYILFAEEFCSKYLQCIEQAVSLSVTEAKIFFECPAGTPKGNFTLLN